MSARAQKFNIFEKSSIWVSVVRGWIKGNWKGYKVFQQTPCKLPNKLQPANQIFALFHYKSLPGMSYNLAVFWVSDEIEWKNSKL